MPRTDCADSFSAVRLEWSALQLCKAKENRALRSVTLPPKVSLSQSGLLKLNTSKLEAIEFKPQVKLDSRKLAAAPGAAGGIQLPDVSSVSTRTEHLGLQPKHGPKLSVFTISRVVKVKVRPVLGR